MAVEILSTGNQRWAQVGNDRVPVARREVATGRRPPREPLYRELARQHTETALKTLVTIATAGQSEAARISAATAILDRGYGRPPQAVQHDGQGGGIHVVYLDAIDAAT
jgi:hypothetical protein